MFLKYSMALSFVVSATLVSACPKAADLAGGVRVTEEDGVTHVFRAAGAGVVTVDSDYQDGAIGKNQLARGVYVLRLAVEDGGVLDMSSVFQTTYEAELGALPLPEQKLRQTLNTTVTTSTESYAERQDQMWGAVEPVTIGECQYDGLIGQITYSNDIETFTETVLYLPQIGIGLLTAYQIPGEPAEVYEFIDIAAVK